MRWLFLLVLSLNIAYITWQMSLPAVDSYAKVPPLKDVSAIILLSEVQTQQAAQANEPTESAAPAVTSVTTIEVGSNIVDERVGADQVAAEPVVTAGEEAEKVVVTPESMPAEQAPAVASLAGKPAAVLQKGGCFTLGPFRDLEKLRSLTREIKSYVVTADFRGREEKEQPLYWVYIKPQKNMNEALETGDRLKENKIKDFYIIREGEKINGVSLGYFRNKAGAFRLAKKVTKLGFEVLTEPVFKTYTVYWLDYQLADGVVIPEAIFDQYMQSNKAGDVSRLARDCDI